MFPANTPVVTVAVKVVAPLLAVAGIAVGLRAWTAGGGGGAATEPCGVGAPTSPNGTFAVTLASDDRAHIYVTNPDQTLARVSAPAGGYSPVWSPDGRSLAYVTEEPSGEGDPQRDLWISRCLQAPEPLITDDTDDVELSWAPDGTRFDFTSSRDGLSSIYVADADGTHVRRLSDGGDRGDSQPAWSPDGTTIAYTSDRYLGTQYMGLEASSSNIFVVSADGGEPRRVAELGERPKWSPDGTKIAFRSVRTFGASYRVIDLDGTNELVIGEEHSPAPIVVPGYPTWRPFTAPSIDEPVCFTHPQFRNEVCFGNNWWGDVSWTPPIDAAA